MKKRMCFLLAGYYLISCFVPPFLLAQNPFDDGPVQVTPQKAASPAVTPSTTKSVKTSKAVKVKEKVELTIENWKGGRLTPAEFLRILAPAARETMKKTGVPASVTLAQAALETGWGYATIGKAKNLFGIKGKGPAGSVLVATKEYIKGKCCTVSDAFRKYHTWEESIEDHAQLLLEPRYAKCMKNKDNPNQFAKELQKAGYSTSPVYAKLLISIMKTYKLTEYDKDVN